MAAKKRAPAKKGGRVTYTLGQGGPSLYDLRLNVAEVVLLVNGPGMLFDHLEVLTSLGAAAGATANAWEAFTKGVECIANCGSISRVRIAPELKTSRVGVRAHIAFGPIGMYQTELTLRLRKKGWTFRQFFDEIFAQTKRGASYSVALSPVIATGQPEHHHRGIVIDEKPSAPYNDSHSGHHNHQ
jgi:hypothetical protein